MSFSIDDLAASLSSSHVGQEALDLAVLHAQLAQTLFAQSVGLSSSACQTSSRPQRCNTPTFPSSYTFASQLGEAPHYPPTGWGPEHGARDEVEDDERMVEDLLIPRSPLGVASSFQNFASSASKPQYPSNQTSETPSSFTSADPFYVDLRQRHNTSPQSVFAQLGSPAQQSPFTLQASLQRREHTGSGRTAALLTVDTHPHSFFISPSSAMSEH